MGADTLNLCYNERTVSREKRYWTESLMKSRPRMGWRYSQGNVFSPGFH